MHTSKVDEVHDARLLALTLAALDDLVERDGDDRVSSTACRIHVGRRYCTTCCAYITHTRTHTHALHRTTHDDEATCSQ